MQRTVNPSSQTSMVRIHPLPPKIRPITGLFFVALVCILHVPHAMALPCEPSFGSRDPASFTATRQIWLLTFGHIIWDNSCHIDASHPLPPKIRPITGLFFVALVCILHVPHAMALPCEPSFGSRDPASFTATRQIWLLTFGHIIWDNSCHIDASHPLPPKIRPITGLFLLLWYVFCMFHMPMAFAMWTIFW